MADKLDHGAEIPGLPGMTIGDFWSWALSDVLCNVTRSTFAEFLVGTALGLIESPRVEWDAVDFRYRGMGIEVKSSAYLQSWPQTRLSQIRYDIAPKLAWDAQTNTSASEPARSANCYVFCLYPEADPERANILDVDAWQFYVLSCRQIQAAFGDQKCIGLKTLQKICQPVQYAELRRKIDEALDTGD